MPQSRLYQRLLFAVTGAICALGSVWPAIAADRPNIIIMMADDMGFSDIGCYGSEINTPTLDQLAADGVRFTQFYNTGRCCPTRASLLTGLYPHQAGIGHMMGDNRLPGYRGDLGPNAVTIAQVLGQSGYATYMTGKWHVTKKVGPNLDVGDQHNWPLQRGFDRFFGTIHGAGSFWDPNSLTDNNTLIALPSDDFYYTDAIGDRAAQFITEHDSRRPFFLYVPFTCPHWPMHAKPEDIAKYQGQYAGGWDQLRATRHARMIELGIVDKAWPLTARDERAKPWEEAELRDWQQSRMEVYAAMVDCMDQNIAKIVSALQKQDYFQNTLILFCADNGGCAEEYGSNRPAEPLDLQPRAVEAPMKPGELQVRMIPSHSREGRPVRTGRGVTPGPADTYIAYGKEWANASNTPFRRYKHWVHEGGIASPLIMHWPAGIGNGQAAAIYREPAHLIDFMATCVDVGEAPYPREWDGIAVTAKQGVSLRPALHGESLGRPQPIFWEHEGNRAMRDGKWKLVANGHQGPWELYDMQADRTEMNDLSATHPERTRDMAKQWEAWAVSAQVKPWPWSKTNW